MKALLCTGLLYLTLLHVDIPSMVTATRIFCQAPPAYVGDPANLTCHFPEDLSQNRKGIAVLRRDSIPGSQYEFLLGCAWDNSKLVCGVFDGYRLLTPHPMYDVTFQIPPYEPGTFRCVYIPDEAVTVESCNFSLKATGIFCQAPPVFVGDPANLTCHYPQDLSQSRKNIRVFRRDSIPESHEEFLIGCAWGKNKLLCGVHDKIKILTRQPMYGVTFQIPSRQPGTFRCHITPEDKAVTVQSCDFTLKGNGSSRDTTERSQRRNEDGAQLDVTIMVVIVTVSVIAAVPMTLLIVGLCRLRGKQLYSQIHITPPCANVDSSPVWEPRSPAVDSGQTQQPNIEGTSGNPTQGGLSSLGCHIPDTRQEENSSTRYCCSAFSGRRDFLSHP